MASKQKTKKQTKKQKENYNIFLKSMTLKENFRNLKEGYKIKFITPITLLVGENGSGKSSVLDLIRSYYGVETRSYSKHNVGKKIRIYGSKLEKENVSYFDFYSDDLRHAGYFGEDMMSQTQSMWASSGEGLIMQFMSTKTHERKNSLILFDELGRGGSLRTKYIYSSFLVKLAMENKNQVIASTHSWPILELGKQSFCSLYSMENKKYTYFDNFINSQKNIKKSPFIR